MSIRCLIGIHGWLHHQHYTSLGTLFFCRRCPAWRWR